jgi:hypothetical protein
MGLVSFELQLSHLLIGNSETRRIDIGIEFAFNLQTASRGGAGNEVDDDLMTDQGACRASSGG